MQSRLPLHFSPVRIFRFLVRESTSKGNFIYICTREKIVFYFLHLWTGVVLPGARMVFTIGNELQLPRSCVFFWDPSTGASASLHSIYHITLTNTTERQNKFFSFFYNCSNE